MNRPLPQAIRRLRGGGSVAARSLRVPAIAGLIAAIAALVGFEFAHSAAIDWSKAEQIEIRMVEYDFVPNQFRFRRDRPYQLHFVNAGKEGHDFTAAEFFASVQVRNPDVLRQNRTTLFLEPGERADLYFIAREVGVFAPRCADHDWTGMKATIVID